MKRAVPAATTTAYFSGPSRVYLGKLFERWGILHIIKPRMVQAPPGVPVGSLIAKREVTLSFPQLSELNNLQNITVDGPLPAEFQTITTFSAGVSKTSQQPEVPSALNAFMAAPAATTAKRKQDLEPA